MQHTLSQARRARDAYLRTPHARGTSDVAVPLARPDRWPHPPRPLAPAAACPRRLVTTKISRRFAAARTLMARGPAQRGSSLGNAQEPRASTHGTTRHTLAGMWPCSSPYSLSLSLSLSHATTSRSTHGWGALSRTCKWRSLLTRHAASQSELRLTHTTRRHEEHIDGQNMAHSTSNNTHMLAQHSGGEAVRVLAESAPLTP